MPRSYASDLLVDEIDLDGERVVAHQPSRPGRRTSDTIMLFLAALASAAILGNALVIHGARRAAPASVTGSLPTDLLAAAAAAVAGDSTPLPTPAPAAPPPAQPQAPASHSDAPAVAAPMNLTPAPAAAPLPPARPTQPPRAPAAAVAPAPAPAGAAPLLPPANVAAAAPAAAVVPPAEVGASPRVMEVQKALARLGYGPIRVDGRPGEATREAIQRFERDRRLPVTGEISDRVVRELNAIAGLQIQ
ncbi:peptidoglycan-binding domain-containing protein [Ancylobacter amanitiformis]|uniref:Peptidoglycan hydrolase-like protein with peptidoglycan-binding domain n=1 Tax=Ancylobacter amanitiformis TaxID=217069 RepID=A0ABU0LVP5_9HYPH|nr:peptidoglycan-binding domain-containing protein [Ancylobacter amanitiformis]MDQ0512748.1 peptidoglycan hydrolase-like protein with peptidoglycan-binding domain [Ancylobacter amanitiformis]